MSIHTMSGGMTNWFPVHDVEKFTRGYGGLFHDVRLEERGGLVRLVQDPGHEGSILPMEDWLAQTHDFYLPGDDQIKEAGGIAPEWRKFGKVEGEEYLVDDPSQLDLFTCFCPTGTPIIIQTISVVTGRNGFAGLLRQGAFAWRVGILGEERADWHNFVETGGDTMRIIEELEKHDDWKGVELNWEDRDWYDYEGIADW